MGLKLEELPRTLRVTPKAISHRLNLEARKIGHR